MLFEIATVIIAPGLWFFQYLAYERSERATLKVRAFLILILIAALITVLASLVNLVSEENEQLLRAISTAGMGLLLLPFVLSLFIKRRVAP